VEMSVLTVTRSSEMRSDCVLDDFTHLDSDGVVEEDTMSSWWVCCLRRSIKAVQCES
jgi:hypothetical protein